MPATAPARTAAAPLPSGVGRLGSLLGGLGFGVAALLMRLPFLHVPLSSDEGYMSAVARQWLAGRKLYADMTFLRPPLQVLPYAAGRLLAHGDAGGVQVRALAAIWSALTVAVIAAFLLRRLRLMPALAGSALALAWSASVVLQNQANSETWLLLGWTAGALLLLDLAENPRLHPRDLMLAFVAGLLTGAGALFKQPGVVLLALPLAAVAAYPRPIGQRAREATAYVGGMAAAFLASVAWMAAGGDGWAYVYKPWFGMSSYVAVGQSQARLQILTTYNPQILVPYIAPALVILSGGIIAVAVSWRGRARGAAWARYALVWLALSFVGAALSNYYFVHYYLLTLPAFVLLFSATLDLAEESAPGVLVWVARALAVAVVALALASYGRDVIQVPAYTKQLGAGPYLAQRVDAVAPSGATLLVWGAYPAVGAYSKLAPATDDLFFAYANSSFQRPGGKDFLGMHFPSPGDMIMARFASGNTPGVILLTSPLFNVAPSNIDDPRIAPAIAGMIAQRYHRAARGSYNGHPWQIWVKD